MKKIRNVKLRALCATALSAALCLALLPAAAFADTTDLGSVHVVVENTTFTGAPADQQGTLVEQDVALTSDATMTTAVESAITQAGKTYDIQSGQYGSYITALCGLAAGSDGDANTYDGWLGLLNDWVTNQGMDNYTVAGNSLSDGDTITVAYSVDGSTDIGCDYGSTDKTADTTLKSLQTSLGTLSPTFASATMAYKLQVAYGTRNLYVTPTAANKAFQVRTYLVNGSETTRYKCTQSIPVKNGSVIRVVENGYEADGSTHWASNYYGSDTPGTMTYTIVVKWDKKPLTALTVNCKHVKASTVPAKDRSTLKTLTLGTKVRTVAKSSFAKCSTLKTLVVKTKHLTKASVKSCLKSSKITKVKVAASKYKAYKKIFAKSNAGKKVSIVKA